MSQVSDPRHVTGVVAVNSPAYVSTTLSLLERGDIVVPLRSAGDDDRIRIAGVTEVVTPAAGFGWCTPSFVPGPAAMTAMIAFTSGTEGTPKGVALSHGALADVVQRLNEVMALDASIREYVGVPVYYSFGFGRCRAIAAAGGRFYIPEAGFNPVELAAMIRAGEVNAVSAVPSLWRAVLEGADLFDGTGDKVRWIEIGSQYMSSEEKASLRRVFPAARIVQHYGLTEASRSTLLSIHDTDEAKLESVGRAHGHVEVKITPEGRIALKGPHLATRVLAAGTEQNPKDEEGWLLTNDLGQLDDEGYLFYHGRADDIINCGGIKLSPEALEAAVRQRTGSGGTFAICRIADRVRGDGILLALTPDTSGSVDTLVEALVAEAKILGVHARGAITAIEVAELPRTATGKVQRNLLNADSGRPLATSVPTEREDGSAGATAELTPREQELATIWREALGLSDVRVDESFYDLGGDSVTALTVVVRMSRAGIDMAVCRRIFQGATIRELARTPDQAALAAGETGRPAQTTGQREYLSTLMVNVLRGLLVASVVFGHWSIGALERAPALAPLAPILASFFSFGTPGFAMAFGVGFGYLYLAKFAENPARLASVTRLGTTIVGGGVVLLAVMRLVLTKEPVSYANFFVYFYSALTFYLLAVPTMPLWFRGLSKVPEGKRVLVTLLLAALCHGMGDGLRIVIGPEQPDGLLRLVRLMLVAKYNYFTMMGGVLAGVAVGYYVRVKADAPGALRTLALAGAALVAVGVGTGFALGEASYLIRWPSPLTPWKWVSYLGLVAMIMAGLLNLRDDYSRLSKVLRRPLEGLAAVGQLALPFFVFHEAMVPLTRLLRDTGIASGEVATVISLGLFLAGSWAMITRMLRFFQSD